MSKIEIDINLCKGCKLCIDVCPKNILKMSDKINKYGNHYLEITDQEKCTGCTNCAVMCPDIAIEVFR